MGYLQDRHWITSALFAVMLVSFARLDAFAGVVDPYVEMAWGRTIGVYDPYGTIGVVCAIDPQGEEYPIWPVLDLRWDHLTNGTNAYSGALGVRWVEPSFLVGAYVSFDSRYLHHHSFDQLTAGAELCAECWELRLNTSYPFRWTRTFDRNVCEFDGGYRSETWRSDHAFQFTTLELAARLFGGCWCDYSWGFWGAIEPYYLSHNRGESAWGGRMKLELREANWFRIEISVSRDDIFKTCVQGIVGISFPLGFFECAECLCNPCVILPFQRQGIVAVKTKNHCVYNW